MHQHFSRTVVPFDLAIHANRSVALQAKQLQLDAGVHQAVADHLWLLGKLRPFVLVLQPIVVVGLVA